jgi:hypothetical protein
MKSHLALTLGQGQYTNIRFIVAVVNDWFSPRNSEELCMDRYDGRRAVRLCRRNCLIQKDHPRILWSRF